MNWLPARPRVSAASLRQSGRTPPLPCRIALDDGKVLTLQRLLRILPGKRLTALAELDGGDDGGGSPVLAKLFIAARGSARHWERERAGVAALAAQQIPTPRLLQAGPLPGGGHYLLTQFLDGAHDLALANATATTTHLLAAACETLGHMHARGLAQADAHLGNFLVWQDTLYIIDGAAVQNGIDATAALENLALLLAQLPPQQDSTDLLAAYQRGHPALTIDRPRLDRAVARARTQRLQDYLDKCLRDCSLFQVEQSATRFVAVLRAEAAPLAPLLADPDAWLQRGTPLKQGRTATLARVEQDGRPFVIKRYNIKSLGHALSRCWRPSRAWQAWIAAHRLRFLGIATPRPIALIEHRFGPLRRCAWLIVEYCPGASLAAHFSTGTDSCPPADELEAVRQLFAQLAAARISHGDLKASNLLWCDQHPILIDLDAMQQHRSQAAFLQAWRKDRARFLRNWPADSPLWHALAARLGTD